MEGVTILSIGTATLGIGWGIAIIVALFVLVVEYMADPMDEGFGWRIGFASFVSIVTFIVLSFMVDTTEVTEYKVIIDDSVKYVEFAEKYEVVDQEGEIYTVRERAE